MEESELMAGAFGRLSGVLQRSLEGLTPQQLTIQPSPDSNPIGWLCWHLTRLQDDHVSNLAGRDQAWIVDGWHEKFNLPPDPTNFGSGDSMARVRAFRAPDVQTLLDYYDAVQQRTQEYLVMLTPEEVNKAVNDARWNPPPSVGVRLVSVLMDNTQHTGQIAYLRGYISGLGWRT
jgi:hypothetical protein